MMQQHTKGDHARSIEQPNHSARLLNLSVEIWGWLALAGVVSAEILTAYVNPIVGGSLHALLLVGFLSATGRCQGAAYRFLVALILLPLIRLLSLTLPLALYPTLWWSILIGIPLSLATVAAVRATGLTGRDLALQWPGWSIFLQLLVGVSGLGLARIVYPFLPPQSVVTDWTLPGLWLLVLGLFLTGLLEELIFRGLLQQTVAAVIGKWGAILYVTLAFTAFYVGDRSLPMLLFVGATGFFFSWFVATTQNLWGVILAHALINIGLFLIFPFHS
jgi:uncharacterized protein